MEIRTEMDFVLSVNVGEYISSQVRYLRKYNLNIYIYVYERKVLHNVL